MSNSFMSGSQEFRLGSCSNGRVCLTLRSNKTIAFHPKPQYNVMLDASTTSTLFSKNKYWSYPLTRLTNITSIHNSHTLLICNMASFRGISLHMTVYIDPAKLPTFWEAFKPVYEHVIAEPECTFFEVYQDPENPGTITWVENWCVVANMMKNLTDWSPWTGQNRRNGSLR